MTFKNIQINNILSIYQVLNSLKKFLRSLSTIYKFLINKPLSLKGVIFNPDFQSFPCFLFLYSIDGLSLPGAKSRRKVLDPPSRL